MNLKAVGCLGIILILASYCVAETIIIDADDTGHYNSVGSHWTNDKTNAVGKYFIADDPIYNNSYFIFTVPEISTEIHDVVLCLELTYYYSEDIYEDVRISSISTSIGELMADHSTSLDIYEDLKNGLELGMLHVSSDDLLGRSTFRQEGPLLYCTLNDLGKSLVDNAAGKQIAFGLSMVDMNGTGQQFLGFNSGYLDDTMRIHQLQIKTVPEPTTVLFLTIGVFFLNRRKTNQ